MRSAPHSTLWTSSSRVRSIGLWSWSSPHRRRNPWADSAHLARVFLLLTFIIYRELFPFLKFFLKGLFYSKIRQNINTSWKDKLWYKRILFASMVIALIPRWPPPEKGKVSPESMRFRSGGIFPALQVTYLCSQVELFWHGFSTSKVKYTRYPRHEECAFLLIKCKVCLFWFGDGWGVQNLEKVQIANTRLAWRPLQYDDMSVCDILYLLRNYNTLW